MKRLLVLPLLAACACAQAPVLAIGAAKRAELDRLACDAARESQAHCNLSDENWPLCGRADGASMNFEHAWLSTSGAQCAEVR